MRWSYFGFVGVVAELVRQHTFRSRPAAREATRLCGGRIFGLSEAVHGSSGSGERAQPEPDERNRNRRSGRSTDTGVRMPSPFCRERGHSLWAAFCRTGACGDRRKIRLRLRNLCFVPDRETLPHKGLRRQAENPLRLRTLCFYAGSRTAVVQGPAAARRKIATGCGSLCLCQVANRLPDDWL